MTGPPFEPLPLLTGPTPLVRRVVEGRTLWVKDEGAAGVPYGGNKVRKLAWWLAEARHRGCRHVVTFGRPGSHHVHATSVYARAHDLVPHAIVIGTSPPDNDDLLAHQAALEAAGVDWVAVDHPAQVSSAVDALSARLGQAPYRIPVGGTGALGTRGWVDGGRELVGQIRDRIEAGEMERPRQVVAALGTGGMVVGLAVAGLRVRAVRVNDFARRRRLARLAERLGGSLDLVEIVDPAPGSVQWGMAAGQALGLPVEPTYTAPALAEALSCEGPTVFVQSASRTLPRGA